MNETTGELVRGRCRATNLCRYCQALYVLETVEMLTLDAAEFAPELWMVLTAREHLTRAECRGHLEALRRSLRKRWPNVEWFVQVEFQRRGALHLNLLIKGVPVDDAEQLRLAAAESWCRRVDAEAVGQWVGRISEAGGVVRYLQKTLSHGLKAEQAPPIGWKGHRTSQTRGYLVRPASELREEARRALRLKRELWRALKAGNEGEDAERVAGQAVAAAEQMSWRLFREPVIRCQPESSEQRLERMRAWLDRVTASTASQELVAGESQPAQTAPGLSEGPLDAPRRELVGQREASGRQGAGRPARPVEP